MLRFVPRAKDIHSEPIGDLPGWLSSLLRTRGILDEEAAAAFLYPSIDQLHDPMLMQDMDKAVRLIRDAAENGERIVVYGDYDVDGVSATTIMLETLRELGARPGFRIPSRHGEGYGLNLNAVREMKEQGCQLLITVDCGITNVEEVHLAKALGMKVIVTDHHHLPEKLPEADACLNPLLGAYPFRRLCGAGVALKITQALLGMDGVLRRIDVAALATVADLVQLADENRVIVAEGLRLMQKSRRAGLKALIDIAMPGGTPKAEDIAFRLAPRLNAAGRLEDASLGVQLLTAADPEEAQRLALHLHENNALRQKIERDVTAQAEAAMAEQVDFLTDRSIIVMGEDWNSGIIGLAAGKLCEKYHFPVVVLSLKDGVAVGSCRSIPGVNIYEMLATCKDLFVRFGGHEQAAGLTIEEKHVPELRRRLNLAIREQCDESCFIPTAEYDIALPLKEVSLGLIDRLSLLEPTGLGNPAPVFLSRRASVQQARPVGADGRHLKLTLCEDGAVRSGIMFGGGDWAGTGLDAVDVLYAPSANEFRGVKSAELQVKRLAPAEGSVTVAAEERILEALLREITLLAEQPSDAASEPLPILREAEVKKLLDGAFGTLLITHDRERALRFTAETGIDSAFGEVRDRRAFHTVLTGVQPEKLTDCWQHIVLLDGDTLPGEAALIRQRCPRAKLAAMKPSPRWTELLQAIRMDDDTLRGLYKAIRGSDNRSLQEVCAASCLSMAQVLTGLTAFRQVNLVEWAVEPWRVTLLPPVKCSIGDATVIRYLRMADAGGHSR